MHTLLDLRGAIPAFIHISDGKMHEVNVLDFLPVEPGAFYVMDRGYLEFARLYRLHQASAFFVTRAKRGMDARRVYSAQNDRSTGVICDQTITLNGFYVSKKYPEHLRRIRYKIRVLRRTVAAALFMGNSGFGYTKEKYCFFGVNNGTIPRCRQQTRLLRKCVQHRPVCAMLI